MLARDFGFLILVLGGAESEDVEAIDLDKVWPADTFDVTFASFCFVGCPVASIDCCNFDVLAIGIGIPESSTAATTGL